MFPGSFQIVWFCPGLVCEGLELAPKATLRRREPKHSLLAVLAEDERFVIVGAFIVSHLPD